MHLSCKKVIGLVLLSVIALTLVIHGICVALINLVGAIISCF